MNWQDITNPMCGGAEVHLHEIFKRVAGKGIRVTLLCSHYPGAAKKETLDGIEIVRVGHRNTFNFYVPLAYFKLRKQYHFTMVFDDINKIPFYTPLFVKEPIRAIVHHLFGKSIFLEASFFGASYVALSEWLIPKIYRKTPFAVVSKSTRNELRHKGIKADIDMLPNAVNSENYTTKPELKSSKPLIGYLGRLKRYKRVDHLLLAFKKLSEKHHDLELLIIGGGDDQSHLETLAKKLEIEDRVTLTGFVPFEQKVDYLNQMWVVANPSSKEGWGLTVIEANSCSVPVVAAESPGLVDSVVDGKTGLLYPHGDIDALAAKLELVLIDEQLRNDLSKESLQWAESFSWDKSADMAVELIEKTHDRSLS